MNPLPALSDRAKESLLRIGEGAIVAIVSALAYWGVEEAKGRNARRREAREKAAEKAQEGGQA